MITLFPASSLLHVLVFMPVEPLLAVHRISMIFQSLCLSLNCLLVSYKVISTTRQGSRSFISSETSFDWFRICVNRFACLNFFCLWYNGSVLKHGILCGIIIIYLSKIVLSFVAQGRLWKLYICLIFGFFKIM